jgi:hypothetical protein
VYLVIVFLLVILLMLLLSSKIEKNLIATLNLTHDTHEVPCFNVSY